MDEKLPISDLQMISDLLEQQFHQFLSLRKGAGDNGYEYSIDMLATNESFLKLSKV